MSTLACERAREAVSARLDGEELPVSATALEAHMSCCPGCRDFEVRALAVSRQFSLRSPVPVPSGLVGALVPLLGPPERPLRAAMARRRWRLQEQVALSAKVRWVAAMVPAALAAGAISMGVGSHPHLAPSRPATACTAGLHRALMHPGGIAAGVRR